MYRVSVPTEQLGVWQKLPEMTQLLMNENKSPAGLPPEYPLEGKLISAVTILVRYHLILFNVFLFVTYSYERASFISKPGRTMV